ncbi:hypothetical protein BJV78DRAFT_1153073 [Lactifluus subvellereus]|nr:hypothetical protein BJV78DRAFT_1153073 [Lactifluus subvellereus]
MSQNTFTGRPACCRAATNGLKSSSADARWLSLTNSSAICSYICSSEGRRSNGDSPSSCRRNRAASSPISRFARSIFALRSRSRNLHVNCKRRSVDGVVQGNEATGNSPFQFGSKSRSTYVVDKSGEVRGGDRRGIIIKRNSEILQGRGGQPSHERLKLDSMATKVEVHQTREWDNIFLPSGKHWAIVAIMAMARHYQTNATQERHALSMSQERRCWRWTEDGVNG